MTGTTASTPPRGPATAPVDWKGVGPHGQGGEGMMGHAVWAADGHDR